MPLDPLTPPDGDSLALRSFLEHRRITLAEDRVELLTQVAAAFARLPFENLTKIIKEATSGTAAAARRFPDEVIADHLRFGTGGTCFALTSTLLHLVRALGWQAEPILADRRYGAETHSGLLVWIEGKPHLLDPGYLIVRPLPLPAAGEVVIPTAFNEVTLTAREGGAKVDLHTVQQGQKVYRLTFKTQPAERSAFLRAWDVSFTADMMRYPVLTHVANGQQLYLQKNRLMLRGRAATEHRELDPETLIAQIAQAFGVAPEITTQALRILRRKGE